MVKVQCRIQRVEYEGIHVICFACGEVGHRSEGCQNVQGRDSKHVSADSQQTRLIDLGHR